MLHFKYIKKKERKKKKHSVKQLECCFIYVQQSQPKQLDGDKLPQSF